jgi:hypothetical protein
MPLLWVVWVPFCRNGEHYRRSDEHATTCQCLKFDVKYSPYHASSLRFVWIQHWLPHIHLGLRCRVKNQHFEAVRYVIVFILLLHRLKYKFCSQYACGRTPSLAFMSSSRQNTVFCMFVIMYSHKTREYCAITETATRENANARSCRFLQERPVYCTDWWHFVLREHWEPWWKQFHTEPAVWLQLSCSQCKEVPHSCPQEKWKLNRLRGS